MSAEVSYLPYVEDLFHTRMLRMIHTRMRNMKEREKALAKKKKKKKKKKEEETEKEAIDHPLLWMHSICQENEEEEKEEEEEHHISEEEEEEGEA